MKMDSVIWKTLRKFRKIKTLLTDYKILAAPKFELGTTRLITQPPYPAKVFIATRSTVKPFLNKCKESGENIIRKRKKRKLGGEFDQRKVTPAPRLDMFDIELVELRKEFHSH